MSPQPQAIPPHGPRLSGQTRLIAHIGYPTSSFRAPLIYNPYFASIDLDVAVVPMGVTADDVAVAFPAIMRMSNVMGALITMPHKIAILDHVDRVMPSAAISGACNAVRREPDGSLTGAMFDGEGFVLGAIARGRRIAGASALIVGAGGVGSAIAASLAAAGLAQLRISDTDDSRATALAGRLARHYPALRVEVGPAEPAGWDMAINATPLGMKDDDPLPFDVDRLSPGTFVGEVVLSRRCTALVAAAQARGCDVQVGLDMLFAMIPAYLAFFGLPATTPERLRALATLPD